jgi:hypothetical protein
MRTVVTHEQLRAHLRYEPETGQFTRLIRTSQNTRVGDIAGCKQNAGYWVINLLGRPYLAHRLAWLYMTGQWPHEIDHIDGDRLNNRWSNLRNVTRQTNNENRRAANRNSRTGRLGVQPNGSGFMARITHNGVARYLGQYPTPEAAHAAYAAAKQELHKGATC